jgi:putative membrane protein
MQLLIRWLVSALSLIIVTYLVPGIKVNGFVTALIAALVIGLVNATIGFVLKMLTLPLTVVTLGLAWLIINALMLMLASYLVTGFRVSGFGAAFIGSIVLSVVNWLLKHLTGSD